MSEINKKTLSERFLRVFDVSIFNHMYTQASTEREYIFFIFCEFSVKRDILVI
jgi:hypothetical protein